MESNFYQEYLPVINDIVYARFNEFDSMNNGIVSLIEYSDCNGMLQPSEICKRNIRPEKVMKKGDIYPCLVLNVDEQKKHVDLSYLKVPHTEKLKYMENYNYLTKIIGLGKDIVFLYNQYQQNDECKNNDNEFNNIKYVFENTVYNIFKNNPIKDTDLNILYNKLLECPLKIFKKDSKFEQAFINYAVENLQKRILSTDTIVETILNFTVIEENAVEIIKKILTNDIPKNIKIEYLSGSKYRLLATNISEETAQKDLNNLIKELQNKCKSILSILQWEENFQTIKKKTFYITPLKKVL